MEYKVGDFRKNLKGIMAKADKGEEVVVDCYGKRYEFKLLSSLAVEEVKVINKDNIEEVLLPIKKPISKLELDLNKHYPCGHTRFMNPICTKCQLNAK